MMMKTVWQAPRPMAMKKEIIQTRNRKMNKKLIIKARKSDNISGYLRQVFRGTVAFTLKLYRM